MHNESNLKLGFLIGAGVSMPAGMPSTEDITNQVLSGERYYRHSNTIYDFFEDKLFACYVPAILEFLGWVKYDLTKFHYSEHPINYEDIYYIVEQLHDTITNEFENPAISPLIDRYRLLFQVLNEISFENNAIKALINHFDNDHEIFDKLIKESCNYIKDVVWHMLAKEVNCFKNLEVFRDIAQDSEINQFNIFSLNHDLMLEKAFESWQINYNDGFIDQKETTYSWRKNLENRKEKVRLLKLHGSINWFRYGSSEIIEKISPVPDSLERNSRPEFLVGTFNKMLHYTSVLYMSSVCEFFRSLNDISTLLVSGYSFGDKGINNIIINWLNSIEENRMIIICPEPEKTIQCARGAIQNNWSEWNRLHKIITIQSGIESVQWLDLKKEIEF